MPESSSAEHGLIREHTRQLSRREFARRAAFAATTAVISPSALVVARERAQACSISQTNRRNHLSSCLLNLKAEGELKYQWLIQTYGSRLTEAQKKDVHRLIMEGQKPLTAFRAFPLDNADQPATVLKFTDAEISANRSPP